MPQMSPLNWLLLFIYFITMIVLITMFMYFNYFMKSNMMINKMSMDKMIWLW